VARRIEVELVGDSRSLERSFQRASASGRTFGRNMQGASRGALAGSGAFRGLGRAVAFASAGFLGGAGLAAAVRASFEEMAQSQRVTAQTQAVLHSTGGAANVTAGHVQALGDQLLKLSGTDDEAIRGMENLLLTFTSVRNEAGKGNDIFDQATKATLDLSVAMGQDLSKSAIQVGKALNDPERGMTALRRVGVQFTDSQQKLVKHLVATGQTARAQRIVLAELRKEFGGSAAAAGRTLSGRLNILRETLKNLGGTLAAQLVPGITRLVNRLNAWLGNTRNQQRVQRTFHTIVKDVTRVLHVMEGGLAAINRVTGSLANTVKIAAAAWVTYKGAMVAAGIASTATRLGLIGKAAGGATGKVNILRGRLLRMVANPYTATIAIVAIGAEIVAQKIKALQEGQLAAENRTFKKGDKVENVLVPRIAKQIGQMKKAGTATPDILKQLRQQLGGSLLADDIIAEAFTYKTGSDPNVKKRIDKQVADAARKAAKHTKGAVDKARPKVAAAVGKTPTELAQQRNTFFDARISRSLSRVQDIEGEPGQIQALGRVAARIRARIGITKDITRQHTLEDQVLDIVRQQRDLRAQKAEADKQKRADANAAVLDALSFGVERAQATKTLADDVAALNAQKAGIKKQLAADKGNLDLRRQLLTVEGQIKDTAEQQRQNRIDARTSRQFRALGLTSEGEERTPGVANLKKRLANIGEAVQGTSIEGKTRGTLARIRKVLSDGLVPKDVRAKIKEMLDGVNDELKNHQTKNRARFGVAADTDRILAGLGLSPDQMRAARGRIARIGHSGRVAGQTGQFALAGAGGKGDMHVGVVHVHGVTDIPSLKNALVKEQNRSGGSRRGKNAGR
jgi:hypothetical protein